MQWEDSEFFQETPTEELMERFGSDPNPHRRQRLFYKGGEMFVGDEEKEKKYPRMRSFPVPATKGELFHAVDPMETSVLQFKCYSEEGSDEDLHRIRTFKLYYHLGDDTMSLFEPHVDNSGSIQGRMFRHQKVPSEKRVGGPYLHWKDLNLGMEVEIFGRNYRITDCDEFTRTFLEDRGVKLNSSEEIPDDPWLSKRRIRVKRDERNGDDVNMMQREFMPRPAQLTFRCCWLDSTNDFHGAQLKRIFRLIVYSSDDTVALIEETREFEGQLFLRRIRLPMPNAKDRIRRYYRSWDFHPGIWVEVFSRPMFIYECIGEETRAYMTQQYGEIDFRNCSSEVLHQGPPPFTFENLPSELRFIARMIDPPSALAGISFILTFNINTKKVSIVESGKNRKWSEGRSFLTEIDASTFSENQFSIGQIVHFFKWRFQLIEAEKETFEYLRWRGRQ